MSNQGKIRIVALMGPGNSGKTHILNHVINNMINNVDYTVLVNRTPKYPNSNGNIDCYAIFKVKATGETICVDTEGDTEDVVEKNIKNAINYKADYLITACHTRGKTLIPINKYDGAAFFIPIKYKWYSVTQTQRQYFQTLYADRIEGSISIY